MQHGESKRKRSDDEKKQWSTESMAAAVKFVNEGLGLREAARLHAVPHET